MARDITCAACGQSMKGRWAWEKNKQPRQIEKRICMACGASHTFDVEGNVKERKR